MKLCDRVLQDVRAAAGEHVRVHKAEVRRGEVGGDSPPGTGRPAQLQRAPGLPREPDTETCEEGYSGLRDSCLLYNLVLISS